MYVCVRVCVCMRALHYFTFESVCLVSVCVCVYIYQVCKVVNKLEHFSGLSTLTLVRNLVHTTNDLRALARLKSELYRHTLSNVK